MIDRFIREEEVKEITGLSRATRWRMENAGKFPKRQRISPGVTAYKESEIIAWLDSCSEGLSNE
jgi:prophage regulatory protein